MEGVAHIEQPSVRPIDTQMGAIGEPARRKRPQRRHVAETAACFLEVGLEEVRGVAVGGQPFVERGENLG